MIKNRKDLKTKIEEKEKESFACGCVVVAEITKHLDESKYHKVEYDIKKWVLDKPCTTHKPNYMKKADRFIHKKEKLAKRNNRNDFEFRARVKNRRKRNEI